eukprot:PhF_6_TR12864/c0_g1_i1/m.20212
MKTSTASSNSIIFITGASGVIGRLLAPHFAKLHYNVVAVVHPDDTYSPPPEVRIHDLLRVNLATCTDDVFISSLRQYNAPVTAILHLAALSSSLTSDDEILCNNATIDSKVYRCAVTSGVVRRVVYCSSNHVHNGLVMDHWDPNSLLASRRGDYYGGKIPISGNSFAPDSLYACEKVFGEMLGRLYAMRHGLEVVCLRIGWVREDDNPTTLKSYETQQHYLRAIYLSHVDCCNVFQRAVTCTLPVEDVGLRSIHGCVAPKGVSAPFLVAFAVSNNRHGIYDAETGRWGMFQCRTRRRLESCD